MRIISVNLREKNFLAYTSAVLTATPSKKINKLTFTPVAMMGRYFSSDFKAKKIPPALLHKLL